MPSLRTVLVSVGISSALALAGHRARALTGRGACVAVVTGSSILVGFGGRGGLLLGTFFASGSSLSRLPEARKASRGSTARNERQVVANGGIAALAPIFAFVGGDSTGIAVLAGSLAAATSDTWATEIGLQYGQQPRLVISGEPIRPGLSGGITPAGTLGSVAGAAVIATIAGLLYRDPRLMLTTLLAGMAGSIADSVAGELAQVKRRSLVDGELTEAARDEAGSTVYAAGLGWVDNDVVNLACTTTGGVAGYLLWRFVAEQ